LAFVGLHAHRLQIEDAGALHGFILPLIEIGELALDAAWLDWRSFSFCEA